MLLDQIEGLSTQIGKLTTRIEDLITAIPSGGALRRRQHRTGRRTGPRARAEPSPAWMRSLA